jgi:selenocysteine-specific elongation factor
VIRSYSPAHVIAGAVVLDPRAKPRRRSDTASVERLRLREEGDPADVLAKAIEHAGMEGLGEADVDPTLCVVLCARNEVSRIAGRVYHRDALATLAARAVEMAQLHTRGHPLQWGIDKEELRRRLEFPHGAATFNRLIDVLAATHPLFVRESRVRAGSPEMSLSPSLERAVSALCDEIRAKGIAFALRAELAAQWHSPEPFADAVTVLKGRGEVIDVGEGLVHPDAVEHGLEALRNWFVRRDELSVGDLKEVLGITRKHAIPLLEFFDQKGYTARRGNARMAGPALRAVKKPVGDQN